ncbi:MAG: DUF167 domain-containing protein [Frankia sp.]
MRFAVRVQPRAHETRVGGRYGDAEPPVLIVRVSAPATDGRANRAVVAALAEALGTRRDAIRVVAGFSGRAKVIEVDGPVSDRLAALLAGPPARAEASPDE